MNFYTLISNQQNPRQWIFRGIIGIASVISLLFVFNYIIDPYNITNYNVLKIKYKFARDDRTEKLNYFNSLSTFDNILIGSSRVYSINPRTVSSLLGGSTYNFGVGTATVEDHLGILLYLKKHRKLPKNLIIGVDFYTFNPDVPPNSYFLSNKELNFLSFKNSAHNEYWSKFLSLDATRASFKTLTNHLKNEDEKPRFDALGWGAAYQDNSSRDLEQEWIKTRTEIQENRGQMYSNFKYIHIDKQRVHYYNQIKKLCQENKIKLYIFNTPLNPLLLQELKKHPETNNAINEFTRYLSTFDNFTDFYKDGDFQSNSLLFNGATHTTANAGDLIIKKILIRE